MRIRFTTTLALALALLFTGSASTGFAASGGNLDTAQSALRHGRADDALRAIDATLRANTADAAAWSLQCRVYVAEHRWDDAIASCQRAVQIDDNNSGYHLWLGRAYGEKASHSSLVAAYKIAKLVRSEFEEAVSLDDHNAAALSDLGQFYTEAPRMLGGGVAKAEAIANRLNSLDPARADELRAMIAESRRDYAEAETNWRAKISASQSSPEAAAQAWMDLGSFYYRRQRWDEMLAALKSGAVAATDHGPALVDGASTLIEAKREPALAMQWLREYLSGNALSETAPAFAVHAELGSLLKKQGNASAAEREFAAARALSANYTGVPVRFAGE